MNIIVTDSRGRDIAKHTHNSKLFSIHSHPGANINKLTRNALKLIENRTDKHDTHIYIIGGICDLTYMDRDWDQNYEETTFMDTPEHATQSLINKITLAHTQIREAGAIPCFATVAPASIHTWNYTRLHQNKTSYLLHYKHYEDMQTLLNTTITNINKQIIELNNKHFMHTPKLADTIIRSRGHTRQYRTHYSRLSDGIHLTTKLALSWKTILTKTIHRNRSHALPFIPNHTSGTSSDEHSEEEGCIERGRPWLPARE